MNLLEKQEARVGRIITQLTTERTGDGIIKYVVWKEEYYFDRKFEKMIRKEFEEFFREKGMSIHFYYFKEGMETLCLEVKKCKQMDIQAICFKKLMEVEMKLPFAIRIGGKTILLLASCKNFMPKKD